MKPKNRDEAEALYGSVRNAVDPTEAIRAFKIWDKFSLAEVRKAKTPQQIITTTNRCPPRVYLSSTSVARRLAETKWRKIEPSLIKKVEETKKFKDAEDLFCLAPLGSVLRSCAERRCKDLARVEAAGIVDLNSAVRILNLYGNFNSEVKKLAKQRWDEYAMVEAKKAQTVDAATEAYLHARPGSDARKFLEKEFFTPSSPK